MITLLVKDADEEGTFVINIATTDEDGAAENPITLVWRLTNSAGTVINSRSAESISSPTSSEDVVLSGSDLVLLSTEIDKKVKRFFTVTGTYNSTLGNGLPLRGRCRFYILNYSALPVS